ncbi:MAG: hypothetical protein AAB915_00660 [Patescibacteria group bacterium]
MQNSKLNPRLNRGQNHRVKFKTSSSKKFYVLGCGFALCDLRFVLAFRRNRETYGFTLLETVVALTVILAAVVGPVSLITRGLFNFSLSKNRVIAANLAQEGIEIVRLIRENNIACDEANGPPLWQWRRDPRGGMMTQLRVGVDASDFDSPLECGDEAIAFPHLSSSCSEHLRFEPNTALPNGGMYGYGGSRETIFSRCVDIASPPDAPTGGIPSADQMDVISTVRWDEHGNPRSVVLRERLTNWR